MDDELRTIIEETHELAKANEKRLKKIQGHLRRGVLGRILYKVIVVAIAVGAFYFLKPYYEKLVEKYTVMTEKLDTFQGYVEKPSSMLQGDTFDLGNISEIGLLKGLIQ